MSGHGRTDQLFSPIRIIVRMPEPDCFSRSVCTVMRNFLLRRENPQWAPAVAAATCDFELLSGMHCNAKFYYVGKISRTGTGGPSKQRLMVLRRRNTVVGGKCILPSALLVTRCNWSPSSKTRSKASSHWHDKGLRHDTQFGEQ